MNKSYKVIHPAERTSSAIFASPHSGREYSSSFMAQSQLGIAALRSSEDAYVDLLFDSAPEFGCPLLCARNPRSFVDLNRCPSDLDPEVVSGSWKTRTEAANQAGTWCYSANSKRRPTDLPEENRFGRGEAAN